MDGTEQWTTEAAFPGRRPTFSGTLLPTRHSTKVQEDGTIVETIDPNDPSLGKMLREELQREKNEMGQERDADLSSMTVQEKMLLLLKLLSDRVKVEAVMGNDARANHLRILAYCLKAKNDEERNQLILNQLGMSLDVSAAVF